MKKHFETLAIAVVCTVGVLSMHQSCVGLLAKFDKKEETKEIKKVQELKNDTINTFKLEQRSR